MRLIKLNHFSSILFVKHPKVIRLIYIFHILITVYESLSKVNASVDFWPLRTSKLAMIEMAQHAYKEKTFGKVLHHFVYGRFIALALCNVYAICISYYHNSINTYILCEVIKLDIVAG